MKGWAAALLTALAAHALAGCSAGHSDESAAESEVRSSFSPELHALLPVGIRESGVVTIVGDPNPPWRIINMSGAVSGLQPDILREFSKILGVKFETRIVNGLPAVKLGVQTGRYDGAFGPLISSASTHQDMNFIDYTLGVPGFLYPKERKPLDSAVELCGKVLAHLTGSVTVPHTFESLNARCKTHGRPLARRMGLADFNAAMLAMKSGRADFVWASAHQTSYIEGQSRGALQKYLLTRDEFQPNQLGMAFSSSNRELATAVYKAWEVIFANGTYEQLMRKYGMEATLIDRPAIHLDAVQK